MLREINTNRYKEHICPEMLISNRSCSMNILFANHERFAHEGEMNNLFSSNERIKILENVIFSRELVSVNQLASKLNVSKGLVSKYLGILAEESIVQRTKKFS